MLTVENWAEWIRARWNRNNNPKSERDTAIMGLGIGGEAGEVQEHIKKYIRDGKWPDYGELARELGDVMHYAICIAQRFEIPLDFIIAENVAKLEARDEEKNSTRFSRIR